MKRKPTTAELNQLRADLKQRDETIKTLRTELREKTELVDQLSEQAEDNNNLLEDWISAFSMVLDDDGSWAWPEDIEVGVQRYNELANQYLELVGRWNKFVGRYKAMIGSRQERGRPLAATEAQMGKVLRLRKHGMSLRTICANTGLSLRTVRTIIDKERGTDRTSQRRAELRRLEFDRLRHADWRARQRTMQGLPKRITKVRAEGERLVRIAKGLEG